MHKVAVHLTLNDLVAMDEALSVRLNDVRAELASHDAFHAGLQAYSGADRIHRQYLCDRLTAVLRLKYIAQKAFSEFAGGAE